MKCTPMKLYSRMDHSRSKFENYFKNEYEEPQFYTERYYGYCLSFVRKLIEDPREYPKVAVKTIKLPENVTGYNTGCSLDKWSKKKPRLKSGHRKASINVEVLDENAYDISELLETLENSSVPKDDSNFSESNSDIEELWKKSQNNGEIDKEGRHPNGNKKHNKCCKKLKQKLKKSIKYSLSKPSTPQTEQIIRVDISSSISPSEFKQIQQDDLDKTPSKRNKESRKVNVCKDEQDFVVRCSQLAIETKQR